MDLATVQLITKILPGMAGIGFGSLIAWLGYKTVQGAGHEKIEKMYDVLKRRRSSFFDYKGLERFLVSQGAAYHLGKNINPVSYTVLRILLGILGLWGGTALFNIWAGVACMIALIMFLPVYVRYANNRDNIDMTVEFQTLYNALQVQIISGITFPAALAECYQYFNKGRLYDALVQFASSLHMGNTLDRCLDEFNAKFDSLMIDSLVIICRQSQQSGKAVDVLADMTKQIDNIRNATYIKKKDSLDRTCTLCQLMILGACIGFVVYICLLEMMTAVNAL